MSDFESRLRQIEDKRQNEVQTKARVAGERERQKEKFGTDLIDIIQNVVQPVFHKVADIVEDASLSWTPIGDEDHLCLKLSGETVLLAELKISGDYKKLRVRVEERGLKRQPGVQLHVSDAGKLQEFHLINEVRLDEVTEEFVQKAASDFLNRW